MKKLREFQPEKAQTRVQLLEVDETWREGQKAGIVTVREFQGDEPVNTARVQCFFMDEIEGRLDNDAFVEGVYLSSTKEYLLKPGGYTKPTGLGIVS